MTDPASADPIVASTHRPHQMTSFFGRERDIERVVSLLLGGQALVTITGPGGVGKTRLALEVMRELEDRSSPLGEQLLVSLASLADDSLVLPSIARALGVVAQDDRDIGGQLAEALRDRRLLLVVDNFEHVLEASLDLSKVLATGADITFLITSRRPLRVSGEQEYPLAPLPAPTGGTDLSVAALQRSPAVQLFLARASAANPRFELTEANAGAIARICARLDGLPLAIELAAARVKLLSPQALAARLSASLRLLTTGPRDVPRRQQTLREAIAWSHQLLTGGEAALFRRMAVFAGGATLNAIEAVAALDNTSVDPLDTVAALVDQSLIVQEDTAPEARFRMLETIREFALEQLDESGEMPAARDAHTAFILRLAETAAETEYGSQESALLDTIAPELDNVRAALSWLIDEQPFDSERRHLGLRLAGAMVRFWDVRGFLAEESAWLRKALDGVADEPTAERGTALTALGVNAWFSDDLDQAERYQERALAIWQRIDEPRNVVRSIWFLALVAAKRGQAERLRELAELSDPLAPTIGITLWAGAPFSIRALRALVLGDGYAPEELFRPVIDYHIRYGYHWPRAWVLGVLAQAALIRGERALALERFQASLRVFHEHGDVYAALDGLTAIAAQAVEFGQAETAAKLLGAVAAVRPSIGNRVTWAMETEADVRTTVASRMGEQRFSEPFDAGRALSLDEAVELALAIRSDDVAPAPAAVTNAPFGLSPREFEVLKLLAQGKSNPEIGEALFISPRTAGTHVANILGKMGVSSRSAAVAQALSARIV